MDMRLRLDLTRQEHLVIIYQVLRHSSCENRVNVEFDVAS